jgi:hypothetical protein
VSGNLVKGIRWSSVHDSKFGSSYLESSGFLRSFSVAQARGLKPMTNMIVTAPSEEIRS